MNNEKNNTDQCCPPFDPAVWDQKEVVWQDKLFVKDSMPELFHIPLPGVIGKTISRVWQKIEKAGAKPEDKDVLMLFYDPSPWKSELYINATKEVADAENVKLSGIFLTKVFDGPYNAVPKWIKEMGSYVANKGKKVEKYYFFYTTCPKCAKKYGHNYVVVFAKVS